MGSLCTFCTCPYRLIAAIFWYKIHPLQFQMAPWFSIPTLSKDSHETQDSFLTIIPGGNFTYFQFEKKGRETEQGKAGPKKDWKLWGTNSNSCSFVSGICGSIACAAYLRSCHPELCCLRHIEFPSLWTALFYACSFRRWIFYAIVQHPGISVTTYSSLHVIAFYIYICML